MKILIVLVFLMTPLYANELYLNFYVLFERQEATITYNYSTYPPTPTDTTENVILWGATWTTAMKNDLTDQMLSASVECDSIQWYSGSFDIASEDECVFINPTLTLAAASQDQRPGCDDHRGQ